MPRASFGSTRASFGITSRAVASLASRTWSGEVSRRPTIPSVGSAWRASQSVPATALIASGHANRLPWDVLAIGLAAHELVGLALQQTVRHLEHDRVDLGRLQLRDEFFEDRLDLLRRQHVGRGEADVGEVEDDRRARIREEEGIAGGTRARHLRVADALAGACEAACQVGGGRRLAAVHRGAEHCDRGHGPG